VLAELLCATRRDTLATLEAFALALPGLAVPYDETLNPPRWELGHVGWFQTRWLERHAQRALGTRADPSQPLSPPHLHGADALFDSTHVAHATRWHLGLPDDRALRAELDRGLAGTLRLLEQEGEADDGLYFFRLALLHEDMHHEAALYMARALGVPVEDPRWAPQPLPEPPSPMSLGTGRWRTGRGPSTSGLGFAFDNEFGALEVELPAVEIDAQAVRWAEFLPFVEAGGYADPAWWSPEGWQWLHTEAGRWRVLAAAGAPQAEPPSPGEEVGPVPRYLRRRRGRWECWRGGRWQPLDLAEAACHLSAHEAHAWCAWAGRRLPEELEWERAAVMAPHAFRWGQVWEWTASPFAPYPGFEPHPYREYSAPWFDGRPVLRGASFLTQPRLRHLRYRNYFTAGRHDVPAGFRSCR
jgi:EgtB-related family protein